MNFALLTLKEELISVDADIDRRKLWMTETPDLEYHKEELKKLNKQHNDLIHGIVQIECMEERLDKEPDTENVECPECKVSLNKDGSCPSCEQDHADNIREARNV